jgi:Spy/CpxP family protein refolding chaperone
VIRMSNELKEDIQNNSMNPKKTWIKILKKTQKQLNKLREDFNKCQNETKEIIKRKRDKWNEDSTRYERGV